LVEQKLKYNKVQSHFDQVAEVDGPRGVSESLFSANVGAVFDQLFAGRVVDLAEGHEHARKPAVPVGLLLVVVNGPEITTTITLVKGQRDRFVKRSFGANPATLEFTTTTQAFFQSRKQILFVLKRTTLLVAS
jgi:hypothetical protein